VVLGWVACWEAMEAVAVVKTKTICDLNVYTCIVIRITVLLSFLLLRDGGISF
jgi:hypothetical protein